MADEEVRALERAALSGDAVSLARLKAFWLRVYGEAEVQRLHAQMFDELEKFREVDRERRRALEVQATAERVRVLMETAEMAERAAERERRRQIARDIGGSSPFQDPYPGW